ncbi:hypothetical protein [Flagellimonas crocea]|nr:hypothetical protein [Muricauda sp. DH64]
MAVKEASNSPKALNYFEELAKITFLTEIESNPIFTEDLLS